MKLNQTHLLLTLGIFFVKKAEKKGGFVIVVGGVMVSLVRCGMKSKRTGDGLTFTYVDYCQDRTGLENKMSS